MLKLPARISRLSRREKEDAATKREALAQQSQQDLPKRKLDLHDLVVHSILYLSPIYLPYLKALAAKIFRPEMNTKLGKGRAK